VLVQSTRGAGFDNRYVLDCAARFPERFVPVCALDVIDGGSAEALHDLVTASGLRGCRIKPAGWLPDDRRAEPLYETAAALGVPIMIMGRNPPESVVRMLRNFPKLRVALDHLGDIDVPDGLPGLLQLAHLPNLSLKFSTKLFVACRKASMKPREVLGALVDSFGATRMMWGSNYPSTEWPYEVMVATALAAVSNLPASDQALMLGETATAYFAGAEAWKRPVRPGPPALAEDVVAIERSRTAP
jgi:predicted TIM-barrel fold metal-dependent hydrolase